MGEIDIMDAAMAGVRLVARRPLPVLIWGLSMAVLVALLFAIFGGGLATAIAGLIANGGATPTAQQILSVVFGALGLVFLLVVGGELLALVLRAAAIRAELEPEHDAFAYMRFGDQEMWLIATSFVFWLVLFGANFAMSIPLAILTMASAFGAAASAHGGAPDVGAFAGFEFLRFIGQLIIAGVSIWLWLRLSLGVVMTFRERQFRLFESWSATRGHVLRMFLAMLLVWVMLAALYLALVIISAITFGVTIAAVAGQDPRAFFSRPPAEWLNALTPLIVVCLIGLVIGVGAGNAFVWAAVARMWRQLHPEADAAKAFA